MERESERLRLIKGMERSRETGSEREGEREREGGRDRERERKGDEERERHTTHTLLFNSQC